jgi:3-oxoacyl-[acyl-carrier protein] reductase
LAYQLLPSGVCFNCVAPGYTQKEAGTHQGVSNGGLHQAADLAPMKNLVTPNDVAAAAPFLLSRDTARITGQVMHVDAELDGLVVNGLALEAIPRAYPSS